MVKYHMPLMIPKEIERFRGQNNRRVDTGYVSQLLKTKLRR